MVAEQLCQRAIAESYTRSRIFEMLRFTLLLLPSPTLFFHPPDSLVRYGAELVAEAVRIPAHVLCCEAVGARVPARNLVQLVAVGICQPRVNVQVPTTADLEGEGHLWV